MDKNGEIRKIQKAFILHFGWVWLFCAFCAVLRVCFCTGKLIMVPLKMLCLYLVGQNCLHLTFEPYLNSETYSRKYEKLPNIVIHACKNITENMHLLKMSGPQIRLCLFTFRPIASKQLNSLTTIDTLSWLSGAVVTDLLWVQEVPGSIPGSGKGFYVWCFSLVVFVFLVFVPKHIICHKKKCNFFCNANLFSILYILHDLWLIVRV